MFVTGQGTFGGSVSGGCVELEIREEASGIFSSVSQPTPQEPGSAGNPGKKTRWVRYGIEDATAWSVGLPCGGTLFIALEYVPDTSYVPKPGDLPCVRPIRLDGLAEPTARRGGNGAALRTSGGSPKKLRRGESLLLDAAGHEAPPEHACLYLHVLVPPSQLVVIGGTHISQVLLPLAEQLGYETILIEAREAWGHPDRFPGRPVLREWPEKALTQLDLHGWTALVAVTHDAKMDDPALEQALQSPCFYIGALGSKRTHAQRLERLAARGLTQTTLDRIHGPVGTGYRRQTSRRYRLIYSGPHHSRPAWKSKPYSG